MVRRWTGSTSTRSTRCWGHDRRAAASSSCGSLAPRSRPSWSSWSSSPCRAMNYLHSGRHRWPLTQARSSCGSSRSSTRASCRPTTRAGHDVRERADWKTEYDVVSTLRESGHEVRALGVGSDLGVIRRGDRGVEARTSPSTCSRSSTASPIWDQNVVSYLELHAGPLHRLQPAGAAAGPRQGPGHTIGQHF